MALFGKKKKTEPARKAFFVATDGNDQNQGTLDAPFSSLALAWETAKAYLAQSEACDVTLSLAKGTYLLRETLSLNGKALNPKSTLTVVGEEATVTAAVPFDAALFEMAGENLYKANLLPALPYNILP